MYTCTHKYVCIHICKKYAYVYMYTLIHIHNLDSGYMGSLRSIIREVKVIFADMFKL